MGAMLLAVGIILLVVGGYQLMSIGSQYPAFATPAQVLGEVEVQLNLWRIVALGGLVSIAVGLVMLLRRPSKPTSLS